MSHLKLVYWIYQSLNETFLYAIIKFTLREIIIFDGNCHWDWRTMACLMADVPRRKQTENKNTYTCVDVIYLLYTCVCVYIYIYIYIYIRIKNGLSQWPSGLERGSAAFWDCGFASRRCHVSPSLASVVCCQVEVSARSWPLLQESYLKNEVAPARFGLLRRRDKKNNKSVCTKGLLLKFVESTLRFTTNFIAEGKGKQSEKRRLWW
jgi:hypothetical protein